MKIEHKQQHYRINIRERIILICINGRWTTAVLAGKLGKFLGFYGDRGNRTRARTLTVNFSRQRVDLDGIVRYYLRTLIRRWID